MMWSVKAYFEHGVEVYDGLTQEQAVFVHNRFLSEGCKLVTYAISGE